MNFKVAKGWTLAIVSLLVIAAGAVLIVANIRNKCTIHVFIETVDASTGLVLFIAAACGVVLLWMFIVLASGIRSVRKGRMEEAVLAALNPPASPPAASTSDKPAADKPTDKA